MYASMHVFIYVFVYVYMSILTPIALLIIPISSLLIKGVFPHPLGGVGSGGVINTQPVKPLETGPVIKDYTNTIELKLIAHIL